MRTPATNDNVSDQFTAFKKELILNKNTEVLEISNPLEFWTNDDAVNCPITAKGIDKNINGDALDGVLP
jgi:hypothetical protein